MIALFLASHWGLSILMQSLFLHRYAAHRMYTMGPRTERTLHLLTLVTQGSSYLEPRAYALLHREHHAFADTEKDPHSPAFHRNPFRMMLETARRYSDYVTGRRQPEARFLGGYPQWPFVDRTFNKWPVRIGCGALYTLFYWRFATRRWQLLALPIHFVMGPLHGAIVNWCGHRYGYRTFSTRDMSRNSLPVDAVCMGELFQNNHHARPANPNFAARRFEFDPTWMVMKLLARLGLIRIVHAPATSGRETARPEEHAGARLQRGWPARQESHGAGRSLE
jgi:stearoyl-CoA desaturase (Delta-9 desaturase)